ncbi:MAG: hypothetical protein QOE56_642 [Solirubrobacterales bacterium]|nr:hypothetical protein [Solirubrobacterales bacterium]
MRARALALLAAVACLGSFEQSRREAGAEELPSGFRDTIAIEGLSAPTSVRFTPAGQVFVALKTGRILLFSSVEDETPTVFADLRKAVYDSGDRGLLGLEVDPDFPARPYVYALYSFDHVLGEDPPGAFPHWGKGPEYEGDACPLPEGADADACPISGRLVRLTYENEKAVAEKVLVEGWCQQFSSHSVGALGFGPEGALFASGGEGASFTVSDYGQFGWPHKNQCGDPPGGEALAPPSAEGGSLRSQDLLTPADPTGLSGSLIRIDPDSGEGFPGNPLASSLDANARRIVAFGFRNPFRFAIEPESNEVYVANVGQGSFEEIDRFPILAAAPYNSGWPCYEGPLPNPNFEGLGLSLCDGLYATPESTAQPFLYYPHSGPVSPKDECSGENGSAITGTTFYRGGAFPPEYEGALFFADSVRGCIYVIVPGDGGIDPAAVRPFLSEGAPYAGADIRVGPEGDLYYLSLYGDESLHRISYDPGAPIARLSADKRWGAELPLQVHLDAGGSEDPDGEALSYAWDLDGDGSFESPGGSTRTLSFPNAVNHRVAVRVKDPTGASSSARVTIYPGDTPPRPEIISPQDSFTWGVGQRLEFSGAATAEGGDGAQIPAARLFWNSRLSHCPGGVGACHLHPLQVFPGREAATLIAPDHDYPAHIELALTATDARGLSATKTIELFSRPVEIHLASQPPGLTLTAGILTAPAPFTLTAIEGSNVTVAAPEAAQLGGVAYRFRRWSDGGARVHSLVAHGRARLTAIYSGPDSLPGTGPPSKPARPRLRARPATRTPSRTARFSFQTGEGTSGFACKLDRGSFKPCRSPRVYRHLAPGRHVVRIVALDAAGNRGEAVVFRWRVTAGRG